MTTNPKQKLVPVEASEKMLLRAQLILASLGHHPPLDAEDIAAVFKGMLEASPAIPSGEQGRDIASAPKDGTAFLVATSYKHNPIHEAYWNADHGGLCFADHTQCNNAVSWRPMPSPGSEPIPSLETPEERQAKIVAWLRSPSNEKIGRFGVAPLLAVSLADAIKSGDYLRTGGGE